MVRKNLPTTTIEREIEFKKEMEALYWEAYQLGITQPGRYGKEKLQELRETRGLEHDGLLLPASIADTYYHIAHQHRSAWTHEIDLRSFSDLAWWNR